MKQIEHNPDVLNCIANLSNDEVFTPPVLVNQMLDLLPQELFSDPNSTFLDPFTKTGVYLREIVKRLDKGLENIIPDRQERIDHILHKQVFGIAITELTALLSRRTLYCSKFANGEHSFSHFDTPEGNIWYQPMKHTWVYPQRNPNEKDEDYKKRVKCKFCGANQAVYDRGENAEQYAYPFIHLTDLKSIYNMKFSVICGNPPYQLSDGGGKASASPIHHLFVKTAQGLNPNYISMITPSRWFSGGKGLDEYRNTMMNDTHISKMVNYLNGKDCFPSASTGSVNYFLWDKSYSGVCSFTSILGGKEETIVRRLNEFNVLIGDNTAIDIIRKVKQYNEIAFSTHVLSRNPFGVDSSFRGIIQKTPECPIALYTSEGITYVSVKDIHKNADIVNRYKLMISKITSEHALEPDKDGRIKLLSTTKKIAPNTICSDSYLILCHSDNNVLIDNVISYCKTKFFRFLVRQALSSQNISADSFQFVPEQDYSHEWTDEQLYQKYLLSPVEINCIDSMIKPME